MEAALEASHTQAHLSILNPSPREIPGPKFLHELVSRDGAILVPAIDYLDATGMRRSLTYTQLHNQSARLAQRISDALASYPWNGQPVVSLLIPQCPELYVTQLAILKAGAAFCPLNLDAPRERIRFILQDVQASVIVCTPELANKIPIGEPDAPPYTVLTISPVDTDISECLVESEPCLPFQTSLKPSDLAYVLYTSGSSGTPKGVGVPHISATQSILAHDRHIPAFSRFLQFAAPTFDVSVFEIFFPLYRGNTLVGCNRSDMVNDLPKILRDMDVDACELTPTVAGSWLRSRAAAPGLKLLLTIGEMLTDPVISAFGGSDEQESILWAMYGPTEAAIHCSLQVSFACNSAVGNIGIPLDTVSLFVAEPLREGESTFRILPIGHVGELVIGGHQLARGYINRPDKTAEAFVDTPYGLVYRTGDKAMLREDGLLECLGRLSDGQVKLRGQRIELGEIEQVALKTDGCHSAVACVINNTLVLFCAMDGDGVTRGDVMDICHQWLPAFMVPGDVKAMKDFPRLPSGKVDRKLLQVEYIDAQEQVSFHSEKFKDENHQLLHQVAQRVLGKPVSSTSTLSVSGLDSLVAVRFASELRSHGFDSISAVDILSCRNLLAIHSHIGSATPKALLNTPAEHPKPINVDLIPSSFPHLAGHATSISRMVDCTPVQAAMLYGSIQDHALYTNWVRLQFQPSISEYSIMTWLQLLSEHNEILRSGFALGSSGISRIVWLALSSKQVAIVSKFEFNVVSSDFDSWLLRPFNVQILPTPQGCQTLIHIHHSLYDGWSFDGLLKDLCSLATDGTFSNRPQFDKVVGYYSSVAQLERIAREFWTTYLVGYEVRSAPNFRYTAPEQPFGVVTRSISTSLPAIHASLDNGVHPQALFQAALSWIWAGILGTGDVIIGSVASGRMIPVAGIEEIFGPCLTTLPLRIRLSQSRTVKDLVNSIHQSTRDIMRHANTGLANIKSAIGVAAGISLFDVMFAYQQSLDSEARSNGCVRELDRRDFVEANLLVEVEPIGDQYTIRATFHEAFADEAVVEMILDQIDVLVRLMIDQPDVGLDSLGATLESRFMSKSNENPTQFQKEITLADAFEETASRYPDNVAISVVEDASSSVQSLLFKDLNSAANRVARQLRQRSSGNSTIVAILMNKSVSLYIAVLAVIKAGYAYLPILPGTPAGRTREILLSAGVQTCLVDEASQGSAIIGSNIAFVVCAQLLGNISTDDTNIDRHQSPLTPAYIIYTSGTTGTPKGVVVTHLNILSNLDTLSAIYPSPDQSALLQSCSHAFDVSVFEIFWTWLNGFELCAAPNDTLFADLDGIISSMGVTHLSMTPTVANLVEREKVPQVEFLVTAGERMTASVLAAWSDVLYQGYGPCETTNICTVTSMSGVINPQYLGNPLSNTSAFVMALDSTTLVPRGAIGELVFGGDQVAQGYLNMLELTNEKFIFHPVYGRLYRSGDLGRMLPGGGIIICGRFDGQIKLRGQRIELAEVDSAALIHGLVKASATVVVTIGGSEQLATFYVRDAAFNTGTDLQIERRIFQHMRNQLSVYMMPSFIIPLPNLPSSPAGKVDRTVLVSIFQSLSADQVASHTVSVECEENDGSEWTPTETMVAEAVSTSLATNRESIGKWTPLASLGLDSITAISVSRELSIRSGQKVPISAVLQNQSVGYLATILSKSTPEGTPNVVEEMSLDVFNGEFIAKVTADLETTGKTLERILPCTPLQEAMLTSSNLNRMLFTLHVSDSAMKDIWNSMRARHPILRTCFVVTDTERHPIAQIVVLDTEFSFRQYSTTEHTLQHCLEAHEASIPPPLDSLEPPISLAIIKDDNTCLLSFICHHAMYDGVAIRKLLDEVEQLSRGNSLLPTPSAEPFLAKALELPSNTDTFWATHFLDFHPTTFPRTTKLASTANTGKLVQVMSAPIQIPLPEILSGLKALSTSLLSLCQSSWSVTVMTFTQSNDVCFGNVMSGRSVTVDGIEDLVFPCFNTIPVRVSLRNNGIEQYNNLVRHFQVLNPALLEYQFTPLRMIQATCGKGERLFDTLLLVQPPESDIDCRVWELTQDEGIMDIPLVCEIVPRDGELQVRIHYTTSLLSASAAALVLDTFSLAFTTALRFPQSRLHSHSHLPPALSHGIAELHLERVFPVEVASSDAATLVDDDWAPIESKIRSVLAIFASCPLERIGRETTIYQLGLDSISAVQVASSLRRDGFAVTATDIIENPTCSALGGKLNVSMPDPDSDTPTQESPFVMQRFDQSLPDFVDLGHIQACPPCTPLQEGLLTSFLSSSGELYLNRISLQPCIQTSGLNLTQAWTSTAALHPMLRTGFFHVSDEKHNYAMARYRPGVLAVPVNLHSCREFNVESWYIDVRRRVLQRLDLPPWEVAVVEEVESGDSDSITVTLHLAIHHALYDAYSLDLILVDVFRSLTGEAVAALDIDPALANLHAHYHQVENAKSFWVGLADAAVVNKFPLLTPLIEGKGTTEVLVHSIQNFRGLRDAASRANITVQTAMQSAWARILSSYHGESSVVFGVVLSGRTTEMMASAAFPCVNTLPVVVTNKSQNRELLDEMMNYNASLHRHQYSKLSQAQSWLSLPGSVLFDTIVAYQKIATAEEGESRPFVVIGESASVEYALSLELIPSTGDTLALQLTFNTKVIPIGAAKILISQFEAIFTDLLFNPDGDEHDLHITNPSNFSIMPAESPQLASEDGNDDIQFLHDFVESSARKYPDATALEFVSALAPIQRKTWSYRELDEMGNRMASLVMKTALPGQIVAVCFTKCPEAYFSILGVLKAGCSFVALDPEAPAARKEYIVRDSGACLVLCNNSSALDFDSPVKVESVSEDILSMLSPLAPTLCRPLTPQDRSYCLYTSGTTGTPKGCELTHHNAVQALHAFRHLFASRTDRSSKCLQFASLHFDVSVLEQYWTWASALVLSAAPKDLVMDNVVEIINELNITHIDLTPSLAQVLTPDMVPSLCRGVFITGGESLRQSILDNWGDNGVIYNAYGPTEATIGVTMFSRVPKNGRSSNIGKQFPNVGAYILEPGTSNPVLRHGVGELCISGPLVGKGYLNRAELTEENFPTLQQWGERVYRTGDLVRVLHDGCLDFVGRADDQIKLRGQRLELGEIDHVIKSVPDVQNVVTVATKIIDKDKHVLVSFVVAEIPQDGKSQGSIELVNSSQTPTLIRQILSACRERLPGYMIPSYILQLVAIPLSSNNKAEVKSLRKFFSEIPMEKVLELSGTQPQTMPVSGALARILHVLLKLGIIHHDVPGDATIFELGLDSISVLRFSRALRLAGFEGAIPSTVMKHPTLVDLAAVLESEHEEDETEVLEAKHRMRASFLMSESLATKALGVRSGEIQYIAPCSALQQGMISRSLESGVGHYYNSFKFELSDGVDISKLRASWDLVAKACPILRTRFASGSDGHVQVALKEGQVWKGEYFLPLDSDEMPVAEDFLKGLHTTWVRRNEDQIIDPVQVRVITLGQGRPQWMVVNLFHAVYDGTSLEMLLQHVAAEYCDQKPSYGPAFLDVLPFGPLRQRKEGKRFWMDHFSNPILTKMPVFAQAPCVTPIKQSRILDFGPIEKAGKELAVAHQAVVQALWVRVLETLTPLGATIGIVLSGRALEIDGGELTIGPLFNTIPFHLTAQERPKTWAGLIKACHDFNTAALPFQHTPLRDIQKWCNGGQPIFDTLFAFQRETPCPDTIPPLWKEIPEKDQSEPDYPLAFEATAMLDGSMKVLLVGQGTMCDTQGAEALLSAFEIALNSLASGVVDVDDAIGGAKLNASISLEQQQKEVQEQIEMSQPKFEWTTSAMILRDEISMLANTSLESISPSTSILELGLDSIDTIKLSSRLKQKGVFITRSQLLRDVTISRIVATIQNTHADSSERAVERTGSKIPASAPPSLDSLSTHLRDHLLAFGHDLHKIETVLPPTPLQDAMVVDMLNSNFERYFNHDVLVISPATDIIRLEQAWQTVIDHTPILRTVFRELGPEIPQFGFAQLVQKQRKCEIRRFSLDNVDQISRLVDIATQRARNSWGQGDLLQLALATIQEDGQDARHYLVLSLAHALYDGQSLAMLHHDVEAAYAGRYKPRPEYGSHLQMIIEAGMNEQASDFWRHNLSGVGPSLIPRTEQTTISPAQERNVVHRRESISTFAVSDIKEFCRNQRITLQSFGQAVWTVVLATQVRSLDVVFGTVLSGRPDDIAERIMFPTMNTVPIRLLAHGNVGDFLRYVQQNSAQVGGWEHSPLRIVRRAVGIEGELFNSLFLMQRGTDLGDEGDGKGVALTESVESASGVEYPVCVEMEVSDPDLVWRVACRGEYFDKENTARLLTQLEAAAKFFVECPGKEVVRFGHGGLAYISGFDAFHLADQQQPSMSGSESYRPEPAETEGVGGVLMIIRDVLAQVSGVALESIQNTHSLYHLGLDSISAIKVVTLLRRQGVALGAKDMMAAGSVGQMAILAGRIQQSNKTEAHGPSPLHAIVPADPDSSLASTATSTIDFGALLQDVNILPEQFDDVLPATSLQVHMLSVWQNCKGGLFFPTFTYEFRGRHVKCQQVANACQRLLVEVPILRTSLVATKNDQVPVVQVVRNSGDIWVQSPTDGDGKGVLIQHQLSMLPHRHLPGFIHILVEESKTEDVGEEKVVVIKLRIHHALYDGVSLPVLVSRIRAYLTDQESCPPPQVDTWRSFSMAHALPAVTEERQSFWTSYLDGYDAKAFPLPRKRTGHVRTSVFRPSSIERRAVDILKAVSANAGVSVQALFFACCAGVLSSLSPLSSPMRSEVVIGIYLANRSAESLSTIPFPTLHLLPLRVNVGTEGSPSLRHLVEVAKKIQQDLREISDPVNSTAGLWEVEAWTGIKVDTFVNFLALPDTVLDDDNNNKMGEGMHADTENSEEDVVVKNVTSQEFTNSSRGGGGGGGELDSKDEDDDGQQSEGPSSQVPAYLASAIGGNLVRNCYPDAVDIEVGIRDGKMDVGVFGPESMVDEDGALSLIKELARAVLAIAEERGGIASGII